MDRLARTADIIKAYYSYKRTSDGASFVKEVCRVFDTTKNEHISEADLNFLLFLANEAGVPQYYDMLEEKFTTRRISDENVNALTLGSLFHESSLIFGENKLHRYQKKVIDRFSTVKRNRFVLTAPTSFGKTFLVYEIIRKMQYKNILLVFPTISLLSENYTRLYSSEVFQKYKIHSLSEEEFDIEENNIFIFTPERFLSFMDSHQSYFFDFSFVDEIYKIDNSFIIDQETSEENERDISYRLALEFICGSSRDILLAGPYVELPKPEEIQHRSFSNFARSNGFIFLLYNEYEIVSKVYTTIKTKREYLIDGIKVKIEDSKAKKIFSVIQALSTPDENTIIYCGRKRDIESYVNALLGDSALISSFQRTCSSVKSDTYDIFLNHLENTFGSDWIVLKALKSRIGIHHGLIPKYIQKEIVNLFNEGSLLCLFATTTITEGVNTSAKNIIITSNKKGEKGLRQFDAKNIAGRAGRFKRHYSGRVIDINNNFEKIVNEKPEILEHKNYDINAPKSDVDYQITKYEYLSEQQRKENDSLHAKIAQSGIPQKVFDCFRVIAPNDKLTLYYAICEISKDQEKEIGALSRTLARTNARVLHWKGFQIIIDLINPIVREKQLKRLITARTTRQEHSIITVLVNAYLKGGFLSMVDYYVKEQELKKDKAIMKVANVVYNVFKYHLVKYLGLFDVYFRYKKSELQGLNMEDIAGIGSLLQKLEYNALSPAARKFSDYGVPFKLIDCYDSNAPYDKQRFDAYEHYIDEKINELFS